MLAKRTVFLRQYEKIEITLFFIKFLNPNQRFLMLDLNTTETVGENKTAGGGRGTQILNS